MDILIYCLFNAEAVNMVIQEAIPMKC